MSENQIIENALRGIVDSIWPLCCPEDESPEEYIVYNTEFEKPELYAGDEDSEWNHYMQIHLFTKKNYIKKRKEIRKKLQESGFMVTEIRTMYEKESKYYHLCFSCSIEEMEEE